MRARRAMLAAIVVAGCHHARAPVVDGGGGGSDGRPPIDAPADAMPCPNGAGFPGLGVPDLGFQPTALHLVDLDGDGKLDVVAADPPNGMVGVALGRGDGSFGPRTDFAAGYNPTEIAIGDVDGDTHLDLVAVVGANVATLRGAGDGTFAAAQLSDASVPVGVVHVALADLDRDTTLDLVSWWSGGVALQHGNGDGTFGARTPIAVTTNGTTSAIRAVLATDLSGGGGADLAVVTTTSTGPALEVSIIDAAGMPATTDYALGAFAPVTIVAGDVDGDGAIDLVLASATELAWARGLGAGAFAAVAPIDTTVGAATLAVGDLDHDGHLDLIAPDAAWFGDGHGTFARTPYVLAAAEIAAGDLDGDGKTDVVGIAGGGTRFAVVALSPGATFTGFAALPASRFSGAPFALGLGDVDGSGTLDQLATRLGTVGVARGDGGGGFAAATQIPNSTNDLYGAFGDLNGDGKIDILTTQESTSQAAYSVALLGRGDGTFLSISNAAGSGPLALGDFDGNGLPDIITPCDTRYTVAIGKGTGDGKFQIGLCIGDENETGTDFVAADFDGDGRSDVAATVALGSNGDGSTRSGFVVVRNTLGIVDTPDGYAVVARGATASAGGPERIAAGDLDRDGKVDLAIADDVEGSVYVLRGHGDGTFDAPVRIALGAKGDASEKARAQIAIGDLDGDGAPDIVVARVSVPLVTVLRGRGDGSFAPGVHYLAATSPDAGTRVPGVVAIGDLDRDGRADLVVDDGVVLLQRCLGAVQTGKR